MGLEQLGHRGRGHQRRQERTLGPDPVAGTAEQRFVNGPGQLSGRVQHRGVDRVQRRLAGQGELRPVLQTGQGCGDGPAEALHIETGAAPSGSLLDEFSQFDLLGMARDARNLRPTVERGLSQPFPGEDQPMPSPDLADAGQLPGDFVQQGRMGFSEVEHGREQSAKRKDSAVGITKQPDHETPNHEASLATVCSMGGL